MTRAQQTISLALLVSSVCDWIADHIKPKMGHANHCLLLSQLYLSLYLELIPLPPLIQKEIIPIVCRPLSPTNPTTMLLAN
jgi:hypothetical protein